MRNVPLALQVAHAESFAGGVSVRPPIAAQGAASGHPQRPENGAHRAERQSAGGRVVRAATGHGRGRAPRRWRGGAMGTSRPTAKPHEWCARARAHHAERQRRGVPCHAPRWRAATGSGAAARAGRPGGQASRPTAKLHDHRAHERGARGVGRCG